MIVSWQGTIATIPDGWALCDGSNGTPDLRSKFAIAAGGAYAPGATGPATMHGHTFTGDDHFHALHALPNQVTETPSTLSRSTTPNPTVGLTGLNLALPPYYSLAFIMKLGD